MSRQQEILEKDFEEKRKELFAEARAEAELPQSRPARKPRQSGQT